MCDFFAEGVWDIKGRGCSAEELPISADLLARLRSWQAHYDEWYPSPADEPGEYPPFDDLAFSREGLEIAKAVKAELPDWTVVYFDEKRFDEVAFERLERDRGYFEYEVRPDMQYDA